VFRRVVFECNSNRMLMSSVRILLCRHARLPLWKSCCHTIHNTPSLYFQPHRIPSMHDHNQLDLTLWTISFSFHSSQARHFSTPVFVIKQGIEGASYKLLNFVFDRISPFSMAIRPSASGRGTKLPRNMLHLHHLA